jgi:hypothetical protein
VRLSVLTVALSLPEMASVPQLSGIVDAIREVARERA